MSKLKVIAIACLGAAAGQSAAQGPFGPLVQLPDTDFIWTWGDAVDANRSRGSADFSMNGSEGGFRCKLTGRFGPFNKMTDHDMREFEQDLGSTLYFIQETAYVMNELDQSREIDWAELDCKKPQLADDDEQKSLERENKARAKAIEDMLRRREKREAAQGN